MASVGGFSGGVGVAPKAGRVPAAPRPPKGINIGQGTSWYKQMQNGGGQYGYGSQTATPGPAPKTNAPPKATPQQNQGAANNALSPSPLDATALGQEASNTFKVNNQVNALQQQSAQNDVALQSALGQLAEQEPIDQLKSMYAANRNGGLYGSVQAGDQGLLARGYQEKESGLQTNAANKDQAIAEQIGALLGGIPLFNNEQANASAIRLANLAANNPAQAAPVTGGGLNANAGAPTQTPAGSRPSASAGVNPQGVVFGNKGVPYLNTAQSQIAASQKPGKGQAGYGPQKGSLGQAPKKGVKQAPKSKSGGSGY